MIATSVALLGCDDDVSATRAGARDAPAASDLGPPTDAAEGASDSGVSTDIAIPRDARPRRDIVFPDDLVEAPDADFHDAGATRDVVDVPSDHVSTRIGCLPPWERPLRAPAAAPNLGAVEALSRPGSLAAEGNIVVGRRAGEVVAAYISVGNGSSGIEITARNTDGSWSRAEVRDPVRPFSADPVLHWGSDGELQMLFVGYRVTPNRRSEDHTVRVTRSVDGGRSWSVPSSVEPPGSCAEALCDKPWLTSVPGPPGAAPVLFAAYARVSRASSLVVQRSVDGGRSWEEPELVAEQSADGPPNLAGMAPSGDGVALTFMRFHEVDALPRPVRNSLWFRRRTTLAGVGDAGLSWTPEVRVTDESRVLPWVPPVIVAGGGWIHIAWHQQERFDFPFNLFLSSSRDGGRSWRSRVLHTDDLDCAHHLLPMMVHDPSRAELRVAWLDGRFWDGAVMMTRCADDPSRPCEPESVVSEAPFRLTLQRDPQVWHGDYGGAALDADGAVWFAWSDTRAGYPAVWAQRVGR